MPRISRRSLLAAPLVGAAALGARGASGQGGGRIAYVRKSNAGNLLHVMHADGSGDRLLPGQTSLKVSFPHWSPDGKKIAYTSDIGVEESLACVYVLTVDGRSEPLQPPLRQSGMPAWSPNGKQLAFLSADDVPLIYIANGDGSNAVKLATGEFGGLLPFWTSDGKSVGFTRDGRGIEQVEICLARVDGSAVETLVRAPKPSIFAGAGALSPDGKRLLYVYLAPPPGGGALHLLNLETRADTTLLDIPPFGKDPGPEMFSSPSWSPDGKWILVNLRTEREGGAAYSALYRVSEDGKTRTRLTPEGESCCMGSWTSTP